MGKCFTVQQVPGRTLRLAGGDPGVCSGAAVMLVAQDLVLFGEASCLAPRPERLHGTVDAV